MEFEISRKIHSVSKRELILRPVYTIKAYGRTPLIRISKQSQLSGTTVPGSWIYPDSTLFHVLNPGEELTIGSSKLLRIVGVDEFTLGEIKSLESKGIDVFMGEEGEMEFNLGDPIFHHIRCVYDDILENRYEYSACYEIKIREKNNRVEYYGRLINSDYEVIRFSK